LYPPQYHSPPSSPPPRTSLSSFCSSPAPTALYTLSLHDALPISTTAVAAVRSTVWMIGYDASGATEVFVGEGSVAVTSRGAQLADRKSTRLNSSHGSISYAVFCLKKKKKNVIANR